MNVKTPMTLLTLLALVCATSLAAAQEPARGQENEFGSLRMPYTVEIDGAPADVEATIVIKKMYEDQEATFYMFAWNVRGTPLTVEFTNLVRSDTGAEMECVKRESDNGQIKCFVDRKNMPAIGTEILMKGRVGSTKDGNHQVGAIVVPFTYTWLRVQQSNGLDAELYGDSIVNVVHCTQAKCGLGGSGRVLGVPGVGVVGAAGAAALAALALATRRRKSP